MKNVKLGFSLTPEQILKLEESSRKSKRDDDHRLFNRIRGVLLVGKDKMSHTKASQKCKIDIRNLREWLHWFREEEIDGLKEGQHTGRPSRLNPEQKKELKQIIIDGPAKSGLDTGIWTAPILCKVIQSRFGFDYSPSQVRRLLHELGFSVQYPKKVLSGADHQAQAQWLEVELPAIKKKSLKRAAF
jgi:transposase